ncbi:MAG: DUF1178 family protein [Hyphomicrobiales bacterium]|nr:DUF1178 family protein [Hyphomicrobiales bacterium]
MIRYRLECGNGCEFDGWFRNSQAFDKQSAAGDILCPHCGDGDVSKALMAPGVVTRKESPRTNAGKAKANANAAMVSPSDRERHREEALLSLVHEHIERNFDYLGGNFPDEARAMHRGEAAERSIYGEASAEDVRELGEEGIEVFALPKKPRRN